MAREFPSQVHIEWQTDDTSDVVAKLLGMYVDGVASGVYMIGQEKDSSYYGVSGLAIQAHDQDLGEYLMLFQIDSKDSGRAFLTRVVNDVEHRWFPGGTIFQNVSNSGNVGTGEDTLYSNTLPANTFTAEGDRVCAEYTMNLSAHATATRRIRIYFASNVIYDSGAVATPATTRLQIKVNIVRPSSSTTARCTVEVVSNTAAWISVTYSALSSLALTSAQNLVLTGEAAGAGASDNDITARFGLGLFFPGYVS